MRQLHHRLQALAALRCLRAGERTLGLAHLDEGPTDAWLGAVLGRRGETLWRRRASELEDLAASWAQAGVRLWLPSDGPLPGGRPWPDLWDKPLLLQGDPARLTTPLWAVISSRKPRRLAPQDLWLNRTLDTAAQLASLPDLGRAVASFGALQLDLISWLGATRGVLSVVVPPATVPALMGQALLDRLKRDWDWLEGLDVLWVSADLWGAKGPEILEGRDRLLMALSDHVWAVALRPGGGMEALALRSLRAGRPVGTVELKGAERSHCALIGAGAHTVLPPPRRAPPKGRVPDHQPLKGELPQGAFLYHYTRACPGPWPGQTGSVYLAHLEEGAPGSDHSALSTLLHLLAEGRIRACGRLIRGSWPVVCLTEHGPCAIEGLRAWASHLMRWSFEPYGLALGRDYLRRAGAQPVVYGSPADHEGLDERSRHLFQLVDPQGVDWRREAEWRVLGDLALPAPDDMVVMVAREKERALVGAEYRVISFESLDPSNRG